ncbi:hypothetical protein KALB_8450 [Kutzneria albida DSM 43870]|uniref:DUF2786 domain-containing protein n=2 Tax=Kutzneria TaxID=43356 RepID=W5WMP5_9PSEU|nr:hypothetical protein KALB_8450 [Kutzneria albida DSM 43870]
MTADSEALTRLIWTAVDRQSRGMKRAGPAAARELAQEPERAVDVAVDQALHRFVDLLWDGGWLPYDLVRAVGRDGDEFASALVVDAIAADVARHPTASLHERWREQLSTVGAVVWWRGDAPLFGQWAERHILTRVEALTTAIGLLAALMRLPRLPQIVPPPGTAAQKVDHARPAVDQKVLARVRGLLAKAESTQFPDEAEALSAKAQELMNRYALERAMLDATEHVPQTATASRLWLDTPYIGAKANLVCVVADANRCRGVIYEKLGFVALIGDELDLEITELLATSLLLQATRAMVHAGSRATRDDESRSRAYRQAFLLSYASRIGERLSSVTADLVDDNLLPVLADRTQVVDQLFDSMYPQARPKSFTVRSAAGWGAGRAAADQADLGVTRPPLGRNS